MPRPTSATLTEGELRIMRVLWDKGEGTVNDVVDSLKAKPKPAYNSVLTLLRILEKKHYVTHRKDGRAFIYNDPNPRAPSLICAAPALHPLLIERVNHIELT